MYYRRLNYSYHWLCSPAIKTYAKTKNRIENTKKESFALASAQRAMPASDVASTHSGQDLTRLATHVVVLVAGLPGTGMSCEEVDG